MAQIIESPVAMTDVVDCTTLTGWSAEDSNITMAANTTDYVKGSQSLQLTLALAVGPGVYKHVSKNTSMMLYSGIGIAMQVHDLDQFFILRVELHNASGYWYVTIARDTWLIHEQGIMRWIWIPYYKFTESGVSAWNVGNEAIDITSILLKLRMQSDATADTVVSVGAITSLGKPKAGVIFDFDDNADTQYSTGFSLFNKYEFPACINIVPDWVGDANRMTLGQLQEVYEAGWDICSHSFSHVTMSSSTPVADVQRQLGLSKAWLHANGFLASSNAFVAPGSNLESVQTQGRNVLLDYYQQGRGTTKGTQHTWDDGAGNAVTNGDSSAMTQNLNHTGSITTPVNPWIPADWSQTAMVSIGSGYAIDTIAKMKAAVDHAIAVGGVIQFATHGIKDSPGVGDIKTSDLDDLLAYCKAKESAGNLEVITKSEWWDLAHGKRVVRGKVGAENSLYGSGGGIFSI